MWQRFTERARRVVFFAQEEAGRMGENFVSTEHLLLGLIREHDSAAARALERIGVSLDSVRGAVERQIGHGDGTPGQDMQLTPRAKQVIDLSYDEARQLNSGYIGTEHLLLGLVREGEGLAGRVLKSLNAGLEKIRAEVVKMQDEANEAKEGASGAKRPEPMPQLTPLASPAAGDLGRLTSPENRLGVEVAADAAAVRELRDVFLARDGYGYQELLDLGKVFVAATGERVKYLIVPRDNSTEAPPISSIFVRILEGVHEGRKGWIAASCFALIGPDETPFPPEESSLNLESDDTLQ
ncbi:MAG: Clp protease N-terminal domain-containing protein [Armatimonadota bacterium]